MEKGSGNVFADLGLANPEQEQLKAHLTLQIYRAQPDGDSHPTTTVGIIETLKEVTVPLAPSRRPERSSAWRSRKFLCSCATVPAISLSSV